MDIRKVKKLIELLEESNIDEIEIKEGEESVRISRNGAKALTMAAAPPQVLQAPPGPPQPPVVRQRRDDAGQVAAEKELVQPHEGAHARVRGLAHRAGGLGDGVGLQRQRACCTKKQDECPHNHRENSNAQTSVGCEFGATADCEFHITNSTI